MRDLTWPSVFVKLELRRVRLFVRQPCGQSKIIREAMRVTTIKLPWAVTTRSI
jgi:hypothetical protein